MVIPPASRKIVKVDQVARRTSYSSAFTMNRARGAAGALRGSIVGVDDAPPTVATKRCHPIAANRSPRAGRRTQFVAPAAQHNAYRILLRLRAGSQLVLTPRLRVAVVGLEIQHAGDSDWHCAGVGNPDWLYAGCGRSRSGVAPCTCIPAAVAGGLTDTSTDTSTQGFYDIRTVRAGPFPDTVSRVSGKSIAVRAKRSRP